MKRSATEATTAVQPGAIVIPWPDVPVTITITPKVNLSEAEAGAYLGVARKTLANWRNTGKGPRYADYGVITYSIGDLVEFRRQHERLSTSDIVAEARVGAASTPH